MSNDAYREPLSATPCDSAVVIWSPHSAFAVALTPEAARESARLLLLAARAARASVAADARGAGAG